MCNPNCTHTTHNPVSLDRPCRRGGTASHMEIYSGDGCEVASTLCRYVWRKGNLFVLNWARVRATRVAWKHFFRAADVRCCCAQYERMFACISGVVTVRGSVAMFVVHVEL